MCVEPLRGFLKRHQDFPKKYGCSVENECQRLVDHVYAVLFRTRNVVMDRANSGKTEGWETKIMTKLFRLKRHKEETWVEYQRRTSIMAKKMWEKMKLLFRHIVHTCNTGPKSTIEGTHDSFSSSCLSLSDRMRYPRPLLCSVLSLPLHVTRCILATLHVALPTKRLLKNEAALCMCEFCGKHVACHGMNMRRKSECGDPFFEESLCVEMYDMEAIPTHTRMMK